MNLPWLPLALLSAIFASLVAIAGKIGIKDIDSTTATTARSLIMSFALVCLMLTQSKFHDIGKIPVNTWWAIGLAGIAGALSWLCYFQALKLADASKVAPIDRLSVVFTLILAVLFLGEKLSWKVTLGVVLIAGGAVLVAL